MVTEYVKIHVKGNDRSPAQFEDYKGSNIDILSQ